MQTTTIWSMPLADGFGSRGIRAARVDGGVTALARVAAAAAAAAAPPTNNWRRVIGDMSALRGRRAGGEQIRTERLETGRGGEAQMSLAVSAAGGQAVQVFERTQQ